MSGEPKTDDRMVAALLRERDSYQRQDKPDRVAQVEQQLRLHGWTQPDQPSEDPAQDASDRTPPRGRRAAPRRTT